MPRVNEANPKPDVSFCVVIPQDFLCEYTHISSGNDTSKICQGRSDSVIHTGVLLASRRIA